MTTAELTCAGWSAAELLTLQERLAGLLADQCRRYAAGDSSLPRETAAELLCSLRYVLGLEGGSGPPPPASAPGTPGGGLPPGAGRAGEADGAG